MLSSKLEGEYKVRNCNLPFSIKPTILYKDQSDYPYCWSCAMDLVGDRFIVIEDSFIHWDGDNLYCNYCGTALVAEENK